MKKQITAAPPGGLVGRRNAEATQRDLVDDLGRLRQRRSLLRSLVEAQGNLAELTRRLAEFPWDSEELVWVDGPQIAPVLERYLRGELTAGTLEAWADALESRDDLGGAREVTDVLFELANPKLFPPLTPERVADMIASLDPEGMAATTRKGPM